MATNTTLVGRLVSSSPIQGEGCLGAPRCQRNTARDPCTKRRLRYPSPRLEIRPSRLLPPDECCRGTRPSQADKWRPELNGEPSPMVASSAVAVMTPTPGIVVNRWLACWERCQACSFRSSVRMASFTELAPKKWTPGSGEKFAFPICLITGDHPLVHT